ncbi:hypothetical protein DFH09DRAFT_1077019 [Mycena vulgaris]|nr:hypothetical protein DFH09DRAFT_1077019 [Mycena vulgaris]
MQIFTLVGTTREGISSTSSPGDEKAYLRGADCVKHLSSKWHKKDVMIFLNAVGRSRTSASTRTCLQMNRLRANFRGPRRRINLSTSLVRFISKMIEHSFPQATSGTGCGDGNRFSEQIPGDARLTYKARRSSRGLETSEICTQKDQGNLRRPSGGVEPPSPSGYLRVPPTRRGQPSLVHDSAQGRWSSDESSQLMIDPNHILERLRRNWEARTSESTLRARSWEAAVPRPQEVRTLRRRVPAAHEARGAVTTSAQLGSDHSLRQGGDRVRHPRSNEDPSCCMRVLRERDGFVGGRDNSDAGWVRSTPDKGRKPTWHGRNPRRRRATKVDTYLGTAYPRGGPLAARTESKSSCTVHLFEVDQSGLGST